MLIDNPNSHPVLMLRKVYADEMEAILEFIYNGQAHIQENKLNGFLSTARFLKVRFKKKNKKKSFFS
jgi:hypothetical protein